MYLSLYLSLSLYMYIYIYIYITHRAVSSHNLDSQSFNLRVSNPGAMDYPDLNINMPFNSLNLPGPGPVFSRLNL